MQTRFTRLVFPYALLLLAALAANHVPALMVWTTSIPRLLPYAIWISGAMLGWRFNRSRVVFGMLVLMMADFSLVAFAGGGTSTAVKGRLAYQAVSVLLPLNFLVLTVIKERGIFTVRGLFRFALISSQPLLIATLSRSNWKNTTTYFAYPFFHWLQRSWLPLGQPAIIAFALALAVAFYSALRRKNAMESGFVWALLTALIGLCWPAPGTGSTLYLASAGLILLIATVESSYAMAFRDELTGLPARRALNETLLQLGTHYTVAMVDIDFFKKFNDRYGHDVGDQVLRKVAVVLAGVGGGGKVFRYGGEEFTIVFPDRTLAETLEPLDRLRATVAASAFVIRGRSRPRAKPESSKKTTRPKSKVTITISIGAAQRTDQHKTPQQVIKSADRALYKAKRDGRNRVAA